MPHTRGVAPTRSDRHGVSSGLLPSPPVLQALHLHHFTAAYLSCCSSNARLSHDHDGVYQPNQSRNFCPKRRFNSFVVTTTDALLQRLNPSTYSTSSSSANHTVNPIQLLCYLWTRHPFAFDLIPTSRRRTTSTSSQDGSFFTKLGRCLVIDPAQAVGSGSDKRWAASSWPPPRSRMVMGGSETCGDRGECEVALLLAFACISRECQLREYTGIADDRIWCLCFHERPSCCPPGMAGCGSSCLWVAARPACL